MPGYVTAQCSPCDHHRLLFIIEYAATLALLLMVSAAAGTLAMGARHPLAFRSAVGMAIAGQTFILLGTIGMLRPWSIGAFAAIALGGGAARMGRLTVHWKLMAMVAISALPFFLLALYPPVAFDETLYHSPFVAAIASSGAIRFFSDLRFPAFPLVHELLCVPAYLLKGDTATHLVALAEGIVLAGVLVAWPRQRQAGVLATALFLGNPIVIQMATVNHTEIALALFIAAGVYCLDHDKPAIAGFLLGTACSVKYLGWYFAIAAFAYLLLFATNRRRSFLIFLGAFAVAVLPMYARIVGLTGNPFFPFLPRLFGTSPWALQSPPSLAPAKHIVNALRLFWDITFARERLNMQPPYSPLFAVAMLITLIAATRDRRAAFLSATCAGYIAIFTFLPQDSRYLLPLLPLISITAAMTVAPMLNRRLAIALCFVSVAPGVAYAAYRLARQGPPPLTPAQRQQYLEKHIPEFRALERHGPGRIYVCGAEQLKLFGGDELLGDVAGPYGYAAVLGASANAEQLARTLAGSHIRYLLVSQAHCQAEWQRLPAEPQFEHVYADESTGLWRLRP
jgi:hypothetical protein